jgi:hypothetical protein
LSNPLSIWPTLKQLTVAGHRFSFWLRIRGGNPYSEQISDYAVLRSAYPPLRLLLDAAVSVAIFLGVFGFDMTGVFALLSERMPALANTLVILLGLVFDVALPRLRHAFPFNMFQAPLLANAGPEGSDSPRPMWFERLLMWSGFTQSAILYPVIFVGFMGTNLAPICAKAGTNWGVIIASVCSMRALRSTFTDVSRNHLFIIFALAFFTFDGALNSEAFIVNYFVASIFVLKLDELITKLNFVTVFVAPWNLSWGSTLHALVEPLALPHLGFFMF